MKTNQIVKYYVYMISTGLIISCVYAISNMINLINLNKDYQDTLFECKKLYEQRKNMIDEQNKNHSKLVEDLTKKHKHFIKQMTHNKKDNQELDRLYNKKVIPYIKKIIENPTSEQDLDNNIDYHVDNRWSYV